MKTYRHIACAVVGLLFASSLVCLADESPVGSSAAVRPIHGALVNATGTIFCSSCAPGLQAFAFTAGDLDSAVSQHKAFVYAFLSSARPIDNYDVVPIAEVAPVFVNRGSNILRLSRNELSGILTGKISNWESLGGTGKIHIYLDKNDVARRKLAVMLKAADVAIDERAIAIISLASGDPLEDAVRGDPGAIAFGIKHPLPETRAIIVPKDSDGSSRGDDVAGLASSSKDPGSSLMLPTALYLRKDADATERQSMLEQVGTGAQTLKAVLNLPMGERIEISSAN